MYIILHTAINIIYCIKTIYYKINNLLYDIKQVNILCRYSQFRETIFPMSICDLRSKLKNPIRKTTSFELW